MLLRDADGAMYEAKEAGRDQVAVSDLTTGARVLARLDTEMLLRKAIEQDHLVLYCQPELSLRSDRVVGVDDYSDAPEAAKAAVLERVERLNPLVNAFCTVTADAACAANAAAYCTCSGVNLPDHDTRSAYSAPTGHGSNAVRLTGPDNTFDIFPSFRVHWTW